jgi:hypothetical protein
MSWRPTDLVHRAAVLVTGVGVTAIGAAAVLWPIHVVRVAPERIGTGPVVRVIAATWWSWALAGAGALLVLVGLVWLVSHVPIRKAPVLRVPGTSDPGFITVNLQALASAAATALQDEPNVQSAKGTAVTDRGDTTVELIVTVAHPAGLADVLAAIDATCADIARATKGDATVAARAIVQLAKFKGTG